MKTLSTIQRLSKIGKHLSKIAFIFSIVGFCGSCAGLLSQNLHSDSLIKTGIITLHGLITKNYEYNSKSITVLLSLSLIFCASEAILAKFAELYFKKELKAETPFTVSCANELLRLGILTITIPVSSAVISSTLERWMISFMKIKETMILDMYWDSTANIVLGIMFLLGSLLCRYGAELRENEKNGK